MIQACVLLVFYSQSAKYECQSRRDIAKKIAKAKKKVAKVSSFQIEKSRHILKIEK